MKKDLKDILSNLPAGVDEATMLRYLQGALPPDQQHEIERKILSDDFESEALEGLEEMKNREGIADTVAQLNSELRIKTRTKKSKRKPTDFSEDRWLWIAIFIILFLIALSYMIIHKQLQEG